MSLLNGGTAKTPTTTSLSPAAVLLLDVAGPQQQHQQASIKDASSLEDIRAMLTALHERESRVTARLDDLLSTQSDLSRDLGRLDLLRAGLGSQVIATRGIGNDMLSGAADTAGRLSERVRALDLEKGRVEETLGVVEQVAELKACVHGVVGSMGAPQDWEAAAGYVARANRIPEGIIRGRFAADIVPGVEVPDPPWVTLENAKESLCGLFLREFEKAAKEGDGAKVTRFFKLFPLIGRGDTGLEVYGKYVCQGVAGTARATLRNAPAGQRDGAGYFYANALTKLFEHIAQIVEGHGKLVEQHYGAGKMVKVIERLQMEADVQGGIILDSWNDERGVERRLTDVKSYPFSFLVQSFLPPQRGGTPRMNSPAMGAGASSNARNSEDEGVNMKEVDGLLNEIAVMLGRWALYVRFISGKCKDPLDFEIDPATIPDVITKSNLNRKVSAKLTTPYNVMSTFFFRRSIEKAFQIDEYPSGLSLNLNKSIDAPSPFIILAVDDVVFIVNAMVQKSLSTSQKEIFAHVVPTIGRILESDFVGMIQRKMRDESYPKPLVQGGFPPEDKIISFIVLINSLEMANDYLARIISTNLGVNLDLENSLTKSSPVRGAFPLLQDATFAAHSLSNLLHSFTTKTTELLNEGLQHLFSNVVRLRLRPVLADTFRDVDYSLSEEELAEAAAATAEYDGSGGGGDGDVASELVPRRFAHGWDQLMRPIGRIMTPKTFAALLDITAQYLAKQLEKRVWSSGSGSGSSSSNNSSGVKTRMSAFGALRMERDLSHIAGVVARGNYAVREVFSRVAQILMVANMEEEEWDGVLTGGEDTGEEEDGGILWVLTEEERKKARKLVGGG